MSVELYHGGVPNLRVGGLLLPPSETGVKTTADWFNEHVRSGRIQGKGVAMLDTSDVYRRDRVYLTLVYRQALDFAQHWVPPDAPLGGSPGIFGGGVYKVVAIGDLEPDRDNMDDEQTWWCCAKARIVKVVSSEVMRPPRSEFERSYRNELLRVGLRVKKKTQPRMATPKGRRR